MSEIKDVVPVQVFNSSLTVTRDMLNALKEQRGLLAEFVTSQLKKDNDYGIIPGTKRPSLFKPGAEKIRGLFGLNVTLECTDKVLDHATNFSMYTYKAKVFKNDNLIAECEGSTNSQEQKYKERKVWRQKPNGPGKEQISEITPIYDILNTLQKMAQKRAFVGAIIIAVGASDFFTQDIDDINDAQSMGVIPKETSQSSIPGVTNVSSNPVNNNQGQAITLEAVVSYDERSLAQEAGFRWNSASKKWTKTISVKDSTVYPFQTREI